MKALKAEKVVTWPDGALYLIDLPQQLEGYRQFVSSWLVHTQGITLLVDVGPAVSVPYLVQVLRDLEVTSLDYILITHIHLDHAGGLGHLLEYFPQAAVLAHPAGWQHLVAPGQLWQGSLEVLGDVARYYQPLLPVPVSSRCDAVEGIEVIATPGHAPHHLCFRYREVLFAGEAGGVWQQGKEYLRPATPPRFYFEVAQASVNRLIGLANLETAGIAYGHFGFMPAARSMFLLYRQQLLLWREVLAGVMEQFWQHRESVILSRAWEKLLEQDPLFAGYTSLDPDIQVRERYYVNNSIKGFLQYLRQERQGDSSSF